MATYESSSNAKTQLVFKFKDTSTPEEPQPSNNTTTDDPIVPDTDGETHDIPNTGVFTGSSSSSPSGAAPAIIFCLVVLGAIAVLIFKHKKSPHARRVLSFSGTHLSIRDTKTLAKNLGIFAGVSLAVILLASIVIPNFISSKDPNSFAASGNIIKFSVDEQVFGEADLASDMPIVYTSLSLNIGSSNYSLYVSTNSDASDGNKMKLDGESRYLNPTSGTLSNPSSLSANEWGMTYGNNANATTATNNLPSFVAVPKYSSSPLMLPEPSSPTYNLLFAARGDKNTTKPGDYKVTILFTAIAPLSYTTFDQAYAAAGKTKQNGYYKMQDMSESICAAVSAPSGDVTQIGQLIDARDGEIYTVKKLADGKCWLAENLRLGGNNTITLHNTDTHISASSWTLPASGTENFDATNGYTNALINADSKNTEQPAVDYSPKGKIGVLYNYCAASAGTYCHPRGSGTGNATQDICPKGWRMPTGGNGGEYQTLYTAYSSNAASFQAALATPLSGFFSYGSAGDRGTSGLFWSSTYYNGNSMYGLSVHPSPYVTSPTDAGDSLYGRAVRCVASDDTPEPEPEPENNCGSIPKMQDIATIKTTLALETQTQLCDNRDGKIYWVSKLRDGNIWMTQNLDLDLSTSKTLTPADTDITSNWTPERNTIITTALNSSNWPSQSDLVNPYSWDSGNYYVPNGFVENACDRTNDLGTCTNGIASIASLTEDSVKNNLNAHYHMGNYYTWTAAIASNDSSSYSTEASNVSTSICPKGWKLPNVYSSSDYADGDFKKLNDAYSVTHEASTVHILYAAPLYFTTSGYVDGLDYRGELRAAGRRSDYWSSTVASLATGSPQFGYEFYFFVNTTSDPHLNAYRSHGFTIRCIAR